MDVSLCLFGIIFFIRLAMHVWYRKFEKKNNNIDYYHFGSGYSSYESIKFETISNNISIGRLNDYF